MTTFNKTQTMKNVESKITEKNLRSTIKQYRAMGVDGLVKAMQGMKTAVGEWQVVTLLMYLDKGLNGVDFSNPLAEIIWIQQGQKLEQYGDNAFRLSEKQLDVVARYFIDRSRWTEMEIAA